MFQRWSLLGVKNLWAMPWLVSSGVYLKISDKHPHPFMWSSSKENSMTDYCNLITFAASAAITGFEDNTPPSPNRFYKSEKNYLSDI